MLKSPSLHVFTNIRIAPIEKLKNGIRDWISAGDDLDVRGDLQFHSERRHSTTCSWIFDDGKFQHWRESMSDPVLWYNAPSGSGKTILFSAVVKHLAEGGLPSAYFSTRSATSPSVSPCLV
jgi:hypothetical protein